MKTIQLVLSVIICILVAVVTIAQFCKGSILGGIAYGCIWFISLGLVSVAREEYKEGKA